MFALKPSSLNQRNLVELLAENEPYHRHGKLLKLDRLAKNTADLSLIFELAGNQLAAFFIQEKARGRISDAVNERQLADFGMAVAQGAMLLGKVKRDSQFVETTFREALSHLKAYSVKGHAKH
jgi:hypothetical protein